MIRLQKKRRDDVTSTTQTVPGPGGLGWWPRRARPGLPTSRTWRGVTLSPSARPAVLGGRRPLQNKWGGPARWCAWQRAPVAGRALRGPSPSLFFRNARPVPVAPEPGIRVPGVEVVVQPVHLLSGRWVVVVVVAVALVPPSPPSPPFRSGPQEEGRGGCRLARAECRGRRRVLGSMAAEEGTPPCQRVAWEGHPCMSS